MPDTTACIRMYVTQPEDVSEEKRKRALQFVESTLTAKYGGSTTFEDCYGSYIMEDGTVAKDDVIVVESVADDGVDRQHLSMVQQKIKQMLEEESVLADIQKVETIWR